MPNGEMPVMDHNLKNTQNGGIANGRQYCTLIIFVDIHLGMCIFKTSREGKISLCFCNNFVPF